VRLAHRHHLPRNTSGIATSLRRRSIGGLPTLERSEQPHPLLRHDVMECLSSPVSLTSSPAADRIGYLRSGLIGGRAVLIAWMALVSSRIWLE
jgi:hypothetical protein